MYCVVEQDGGEEADDERPVKATTVKPHVHQQAASLHISGRGSAYFTRCGSLGRMSGVAEESPWDALNEVGRGLFLHTSGMLERNKIAFFCTYTDIDSAEDVHGLFL